MHHVIWIEHDGSWTWSIEEGKAFEEDHKVLARDDGFPTRGDAKEDMQKAWAKLLKSGKRPGKLSDLKKPSKSAAEKKTNSKTSASTVNISKIPEWALVAEGNLVALFVKKADAVAYGKQHHLESHSVIKASIGVSIG